MKFQWADPFGANISNFDVYLYDVAAGTTQCLTTTNSALTSYYLSIPFSAGQYTLEIATPNQAAAGKAIKLLVDESLSLNYSQLGVSPRLRRLCRAS